MCAVAARVPRARRWRVGSARAQPAERSRFCGRAHGSGAALGRWSGAGGARRAGWGSARPRQACERRGGQRARGTALRHGLTRFCTTCTVLEAAHGSRWLERAERAHRAQWWREQIRVLGISEPNGPATNNNVKVIRYLQFDISGDGGRKPSSKRR